MNFLNGLKDATNFTYTENGAITHKTTRSDLLDMFAFGGAYRKRSEEDIIVLFKKAYAEDAYLARKCLFYLRDVRGGQGERRFFRVCLKWLANNDPDVVVANIENIIEYGRYDDWYVLLNTPVKNVVLAAIKCQLGIDVQSNTPSLLAKWLPSENTSSKATRQTAHIIREYLGFSHRQYRKTLSILREKIRIVEKLMSANRWDEIEFDKLPSKAGIKYKNAFARRDIIKAKYESFAKDTTTKVNAKTLYPYEVVAEALKTFRTGHYWNATLPALDDTNRLMVNKYWDNLADYFNGASLNALAVVDTSGSMVNSEASAPINVAISLGLYCAEKAKGPFANHYISFASRPQLIETNGADFVDKVYRIYKTNLVDNTNIEAVFDLLLNTAIANNCSQDEIPQNIIIISDMEFDAATRCYRSARREATETLLEGIARKWAIEGYKMPHLIFWNVDARQNNVPMLGNGPISYVSGMSPSIFETIMSGKTGYDLMLEKLNSERYNAII